MKKLLQINVVVNWGSTGRIVEEIGQFAMQKGFDSYIAYGRNPRFSQSNLIRIGNDWSVKRHVIQTRLFDNHGFASTYTTKKLISQIEKIKPDIIHLHNIHGYYINVEVLFNYLTEVNIPILWTLHDCWPFTGHCSHFEFVNCERWKTECSKCPQKNEYPGSWFIDRSRKNYIQKKKMFSSIKNLTIVTPSRWLGDIVSDSFFNEYQKHVINNGVDLQIFNPKQCSDTKVQYSIDGRFVIIGVASIWDDRKGFDDFIRLNQLIGKDCVILLVGLSPLQKRKLPSNIIGIERTENVIQLVELYSAADVFVNPTLEDNFPTTNLEALACGTPVITYRTGGSVESVTNETGYIVEKQNVKALWEAIQQVKQKGKAYYSAHCVQRAYSLYNKEDRYIDYVNLYESLLQDKE